MRSIEYLTELVGYLTGFAAAGIGLNCILVGYTGHIEGMELPEIFQKLGKRIRAGVILILITSIIAWAKGYWL